jgi:hypothetical protein
MLKNSNKYFKKNQHLLTKIIDPLSNRDQFPSFSPLTWRVFDEFCSLSKKYKFVFPSQEFIANSIGVKRETVNRRLALLSKSGLVIMQKRHRHSNLYFIPPSVFKEEVRSILARYCTSLRVLSIALLLCLFPGRITPTKESKLRINNYIYTSSDRGWSMKHENHPIPMGVREIKRLKLTKWGQILLSGFPPEAIQHADHALQSAKNVRDPFGWFFKLCQDYCEREELKPDWAYIEALKTKYGYKQGKPLLMPYSSSTVKPRSGMIDFQPKKEEETHIAPMYKKFDCEWEEVDKEKELQEREKAKQTPGWKWIEALLGKPFDPPIPDRIMKRGIR